LAVPRLLSLNSVRWRSRDHGKCGLLAVLNTLKII
jgi:hypothetical protein